MTPCGQVSWLPPSAFVKASAALRSFSGGWSGGKLRAAVNFRLKAEATRSCFAAVLILCLTASVPAFAQDPPEAAPAGRAGRAQGVRPAELAAMLDAYAIVQAQTALQLTDAQYGQFVTRLKRLQETRRRNGQTRNRLLQQLRALVAPGVAPDEPAIRDKLKTLRDHDEQTVAALRRESEALDEVLDARQQALFKLLEERLERQKLDLLMRARDRAARPGSKPGAGDR